MQAAELRGDPL